MKYWLFLLIASNSFAQSFDQRFTAINLGLGQFYETPNQIENESTNYFSLSPFINLSALYNINQDYSLSPHLFWVIQKDTADESSNQNIFNLGLMFNKYISENHLVGLGTSLFIYSLSGDGSEQELPNGNSETTYFSPAERKNSYQQTLDFNYQYHFDQYFISSSLYTYKILNNELREYSIAFSFNKAFGIGEK